MEQGNQHPMGFFGALWAFFNSDLIKAALLGLLGVIGSWYSIKSDLRSLQEGQVAAKEKMGEIIHYQERRDVAQDERINNISRELSDNNRELRSDIKDLRSDIRNIKR